MKKILLGVGIGILCTFCAVALAGMYKFNYLANKDGYDVDGNPVRQTKNCAADGTGCQQFFDKKN